jgi:uncharacterized membrane protein YsdA (DUF1294 family)
MNPLISAFNFILIYITGIYTYLSIIIFIVACVTFGLHQNQATVGLLLTHYILLSPITFYLYYVDKSSAKQQRWRIPEANLHMLELAGGWPGAIAAQQLFRHKNRKENYQTIFWLILMCHVSLLFSVLLFKGQFAWVSLLLFVIICGAIKYRQG